MSDPSQTVVAIDVQALQGADPERGIPRWLAEFASSLKRTGLLCIGLTNPNLHEIHPQFNACFDAICENSRRQFRDCVSGHRSIYLVGSPFEPVRPIRSLLPDHVVQSQIPIVTVMYDLALYRFPDLYQIRKGDHETYAARKRAFCWSDHFFCISRSTANDLANLWGVPNDRISAIGTGISDFFCVDHSDHQIASAPFVMTVGRRDPRKQTDFLIRMFANLSSSVRERLKLVIVCRLDDEIRKIWESLALNLGFRPDQLVLTGVITDEELAHLYRNCEVFVEPSLYEGFGFPLAEAAACGAVSICSDSSSLPEILPTRENLFDPTNLSQAAGVLERALTDSDFRDRLKVAGRSASKRHRWDDVGVRAELVIRKLAREVEVPRATVADYVHRGFPVGALGRTIPLACVDD